ncbi:Dynein heavy chain 9, axonemal [Desmophyllum pertusum]|uniref:Dynein heavy chain 9, axonemal n=1 Tax=Desmophyllum pertusum TaxID=174260 RepID=A0A9W9YI84_9CNID|nr:Dynein heavy chain 9, axonemal [Desmophyllum pertusum]
MEVSHCGLIIDVCMNIGDGVTWCTVIEGLWDAVAESALGDRHWQQLMQATNAKERGSHLESIFIGSEDIRNQLPEDSKRFDGICFDFKELTDWEGEAAQMATNAVQVSANIGIAFTSARKRLELSISETKRLAFHAAFLLCGGLARLVGFPLERQPVQLRSSLVQSCLTTVAQLNGLFDDEDGLIPPRKVRSGCTVKKENMWTLTWLCDCKCGSFVEDPWFLEAGHGALQSNPRLSKAVVALCGTQSWWTTKPVVLAVWKTGMGIRKCAEGLLQEGGTRL